MLHFLLHLLPAHKRTRLLLLLTQQPGVPVTTHKQYAFVHKAFNMLTNNLG